MLTCHVSISAHTSVFRFVACTSMTTPRCTLFSFFASVIVFLSETLCGPRLYWALVKQWYQIIRGVRGCVSLRVQTSHCEGVTNSPKDSHAALKENQLVRSWSPEDSPEISRGHLSLTIQFLNLAVHVSGRIIGGSFTLKSHG